MRTSWTFFSRAAAAFRARASLQAIHRVDQVEELHRAPGLIGLEVAHQVPAHLRPQGGDLVLGLLEIILPKKVLAGGDGGPDPLQVHGLAHRHQAHAAGVPAGPMGRGGDGGPHFFQVMGDGVHELAA